MRARAIQALDRLDPRLLVGAAVLIVAVLAFEGWMLVLRKPFAEYRQIVTNRIALSSAVSQVADPSSELDKLAADLQHLSAKLSGKLQLPASDDKIAASLMEALDRSALQHGVKLSGVKPRERKPVSMFEEVSFEVGADGGYLPLCEWMLGFENAVGNNVNVTEFDMKAIDEGRKVQLTLNLALYRPQLQAEVAK